MITPPFQVTQDEEFIFIYMKIKYIKASECDFYIDGTLFKFYCKPYFLRLTMPQPLVEDGRERAAYDVEKGELQVKVAKKNKGQVFENLDMLSLLLGIPTTTVQHSSEEIEDITHIKAQEEEEDEIDSVYSKLVLKPANSRPKGYKPSIEVVGESYTSGFESMKEEEEEEKGEKVLEAPSAAELSSLVPDLSMMEGIENEEDDIYDWSHPQTVPRPFEEKEQNFTKYGFMDRYSGFFEVDRPDTVDIEDADVFPEESRRQARLLSENASFNYDHYIADYMDTSAIDNIRRYVCNWTREYDALRSYEINPSSRPQEISPGISTTSLTGNDELAVLWTDDHRNVLLKLPVREYEVSGDHQAMLGLVDLMFAYAYNLRTMEGENTVESSWTIVKLSSVLSWFDKLQTLQEALISSARRSLIFPLYRNWTLVQSIFQDLYQLFYLGKRALLRALIEMKHICDTSETRHLLSRLYLDDYCIWIQRIPKKRFANIATQILDMSERISKSDVGLPLEELERLALEDSQTQSEIEAMES